MDIITIKKGTTVKVNGTPFKLVADTQVFGEEENPALTDDNQISHEHSSYNPLISGSTK